MLNQETQAGRTGIVHPSGREASTATPAQFEFEKKAAQLNMRVPQPLLDAVKVRAREIGIPYTRYIRKLIERDIASHAASSREEAA